MENTLDIFFMLDGAILFHYSYLLLKNMQWHLQLNFKKNLKNSDMQKYSKNVHVKEWDLFFRRCNIAGHVLVKRFSEPDDNNFLFIWNWARWRRLLFSKQYRLYCSLLFNDLWEIFVRVSKQSDLQNKCNCVAFMARKRVIL